jgi:uncharacterized repeat protein (TIGR01451 family)
MAIILIGFLCLIVAGSMAVRFAPSWKLPSNMDSNLDPNSDYLTRRSQGYVEPLDPAILTPPVWIGFFQTPGAAIPQQTPLPLPTQTAAITSTSVGLPTTTIPAATISSPTSTIRYIPGSPTNTQRPAPRDTGTATVTSTATATATPTATGTPSINADLAIIKDDGVLMYSAGGVLTYKIIVTNNGPANVTGALITDMFPAQFENWAWTCTSQNGGASGCDATTSNPANFSDTVDLPNGASIQYTVTAHVLKTASGDLTNTVRVDVPATNVESDSSNNIASDTDQFLATVTLPIGNIGETKDNVTELLPPGDFTTIAFSTPLVVNGHGGYDLVYYEMPNGAGIAMDIVGLEISDGNNWYTIFYWGDDAADTNSNMDISVLGGSETDNRDFTSPPPGLLYDGTGVVIELDGIVPPGTYPYIRIISPPTAAYPYGVSNDGGCEIDAIAILP